MKKHKSWNLAGSSLGYFKKNWAFRQPLAGYGTHIIAICGGKCQAMRCRSHVAREGPSQAAAVRGILVSAWAAASRRRLPSTDGQHHESVFCAHFLLGNAAGIEHRVRLLFRDAKTRQQGVAMMAYGFGQIEFAASSVSRSLINGPSGIASVLTTSRLFRLGLIQLSSPAISGGSRSAGPSGRAPQVHSISRMLPAALLQLSLGILQSVCSAPGRQPRPIKQITPNAAH